MTQCYDDAEGALHTGFFTTSLAKVLDGKVPICDAPPKNRPYYLIVWGLGLGTYLLELLKTYEPQHVIIVEDNLDFFYWSTHYADWSDIFKNLQQNGTKISFVVHAEWEQLIGNTIAIINSENPLSIDGIISWYTSESSNMLRAYRQFNGKELSKLTGFRVSL